jgi:ribosomal protein S18 acetylase RimI-like enzyme
MRELPKVPAVTNCRAPLGPAVRLCFGPMDPTISLRPYREDDEDAVTALWNSVFPDPAPWNQPAFIIAKKLALQRELLFVAVSEGAVVGTAMGGFDGHRGWLYTVAVRPDKQRRAIGSTLVRRIENALAALGCPKLNLQVRPPNIVAVAFYESLGYSVEERISMGKRLGG